MDEWIGCFTLNSPSLNLVIQFMAQFWREREKKQKN